MKKILLNTIQNRRKSGNERTGMEPALEGEAAVLDVKGKAVDVEGAGGDHLDGLVVAHQALVGHVDVGNVRGLAHVYAEVRERETDTRKEMSQNVMEVMVANYMVGHFTGCSLQSVYENSCEI